MARVWFYALLSTAVVRVDLESTSGFINSMKCFQSQTKDVQCITSKLDANVETVNGIRSLVTEDTDDLAIFCTSMWEFSFLQANFFAHLKKLRSLKLWACKFSKSPFEGLVLPSTIRAIHLQNTFTNIDQWISPAQIPCSFPSVTNVSMTHMLWPEGFSEQQNPFLLDCLTIGCCKSLRSLNISLNLIPSIHRHTFRGLDSLQVLDLGNNYIAELPKDVFGGLISLQRIILTGNPLLHLDLQVFDKNSKLADVTLEYESMYMVGPDLINAWHGVHPVTYKDRCTELTNIDFVNQLFVRHATTLSLCIRNDSDYNEIFLRNAANVTQLSVKTDLTPFEIPDFAFVKGILTKMVNLTKLTLDSVVSEFFPNMFAALTELQTLSLQNNNFQFRNITFSIFSGLRQLESLELGGNDLAFDSFLVDMPPFFTNLPQLKKVYLEDNHMRVLKDDFFDGLTEIEIISLQGNSLSHVPRSVCNRENSFKLRELYLGDNGFGAVEEDAFENCINLRIIDMTSNSLLYLGDPSEYNTIERKNNSIGPFRSLLKLANLFLAYNKLEHFDFSMIPISLQYLDLSFNEISSLTDVWNVCSNLNLSTLLLQENHIKYISFNTLPPSLTQILFIQSDSVTDSTILLEKSTFHILTRLELVVIGATYFQQLKFDKLVSAQFCNKHGIYFEFLFGYHENCPAVLRKQEVYDSNDLQFGKYELVTEKIPSFKLFPYYDAEAFSYTLCSFQQDCVPRGKGPPGVETFDHTIQILYCGRAGMRHIPLHFPNVSVNELHLDGNNITVVQPYAFQSLGNNMSLTNQLFYIYLNNSHVSFIGHNAFSGLEYLNEIHLENNNLIILNFDMISNSEGYWLDAELYLQNNSIVDVESHMIAETNQYLFGPSSIYLQHNNLTGIPWMLFKLISLKIINVSNNKIDNVRLPVYQSTNMTGGFYIANYSVQDSPFEVTLGNYNPIREFFFRHNLLKNIEPDAFKELPNMEILDLYGNLITDLKGLEFIGVTSLEYLYLGNNQISTIHRQTFQNLTKLKVLNLENNKINLIHQQLFESLEVLNELNIDGNVIPHLKTNLFHKLGNLKILRLSKCYINIISGEFMGLHKLQELYLNDNRLSTLNGKLFKYLTNLKRLYIQNNHLKHVEYISFMNLRLVKMKSLNNVSEQWHPDTNLEFVSLTNNRFSCDCEFLIELRSWLDQIRDTKLNVVSSSISCFTSSGRKIPVMEFDLTSCQMTYELPLGISAGIAFLLFVVISAMYYWRTEVQVWAYSRYGLRLFYNVEEDNNKLFDVFVSFSNDDARFVVQDLVSGLKDYKVCVHYKHFPPGAYIADSIVEAVEQSRRTLLVFSTSFVTSAYCKFEFRVAHHKSLEDRCCRLILVLLEDVDEGNMDPEQKAYFRTNTYLRWDDPAFWRKLYFGLPNIKTALNTNQILDNEMQNLGNILEAETAVQ